jgi:NAD(P)H-hydrate epimerase
MRRIDKPPPLPPRPVDGHKGLFGRVLVVGGSETMIGASVLAGTAALRMGAGLVQIAVPRSILSACLSITPELIGLELDPRSTSELARRARDADAIIVGPGLGQSPTARARVLQLIRLDKPIVLDADALNILAAQKRFPTIRARAALTPHPGEMKRLAHHLGKSVDVPSDEPGRIDLAVRAATTFGQTIVLKGHRTVVADAGRVYVNTTGDSSLSKAGSGDVLSGMIGCLLAQRMDPFDAACCAVHLHGRAGELAGQALGRRCVLARDVIERLPEAISEVDRGSTGLAEV